MPDNAPQQSFNVFKDANGRWRWVAISSTAYQDRDGEIVSTKALANDVARADADGKYGPLRWWHVGQPDPLNADAPWGKGVDLGWCDFNAMSGRALIESGTFVSEAIGAAVAAKAADLGLSIGFSHPLGQPDAERVFHDIRRFERSLAPKERVSNPFTTLTVSKELRMDEMKIAALKSLGFTDAMITNVVAQAQTVEKTAADQGVRFKADDFAADVALFNRFKAAGLDDAQALKAVAATKEPPVAKKEDETPAEPTAAPAAPATPATQPAATQTASPGIEALGNALVAQLVPQLTQAITTAMSGATTQKDSEIAQLKQQQAALLAQQQQLDTQLKTLIGDQPASNGLMGANRASESPEAALIALGLKANGNGQPTANSADMFAEWIISGQPPASQQQSS